MWTCRPQAPGRKIWQKASTTVGHLVLLGPGVPHRARHRLRCSTTAADLQGAGSGQRRWRHDRGCDRGRWAVLAASAAR